jgi:hypothetical protein
MQLLKDYNDLEPETRNSTGNAEKAKLKVTDTEKNV